MPTIFVCYRREDSGGYAGRLFGDLEEHFGEGHVFLDVSGIRGGDEFDQAIARQLESTDVFLAVIGPRWLMSAEPEGPPRIHDPADYVRVEIATALARRIRVIPVLVQRGVMPGVDTLPPDLKALSRRQAIEVSDSRWDYDVGQLIRTIDETAGRAPRRRHVTGLKAVVPGVAILAAVVLIWRSLPAPAVEPAITWERGDTSFVAGGTGGDVKAVACPADAAIVGLRGTTGASGSPEGDPGVEWIWDLGFTCAPVSLERVTQTRYEGRTGAPVRIDSMIGGGGGTGFSIECPVNQIMTAFDAESRLRAAGDARYLNYLVARCAGLAANYRSGSWKVEIVTTTNLAPVGKALLGGSRTTFSCADGHAGGDGAVTRVVAYAGTLVDGIAVGCSRAIVENP